MKQAMKKWLNQHQITFDPNTANSICNRFGLDGEKADECLGLCYQLESDKITQAEFTGGLCVLTGKEPEEVMGVLRDIKPVSDRKVVAVIGNKGEMVKGLTKAIADKELATACYNALANHGIAVHYTILGKMVRRYYKPEITDQQVLSCLSRNKDLFRRLEGYPGAYFLAGKKEGQTYPEMEVMGVLKGMKGKENPMTEANEKLEAINKKWRELDELQIATHLESMSARKWAVLNSLDAIGLELTKGYVAIGSYIDGKMETIEMAIKDLKSSNEIDERY